MKKLIKHIDVDYSFIVGKKNVLEYMKKFANEKWDFTWNGYTYSFNLKDALDELSSWDSGLIVVDKYPYIYIEKVGPRTYTINGY